MLNDEAGTGKLSPYIYVGMCRDKHKFVMMKHFIYGVLLAYTIDQARIITYQNLRSKYDSNDFEDHFVMIESFDARFVDLAQRLGYKHDESTNA